MQNRFNLFGVEELTPLTAGKLLNKAMISRRDKIFLEEAIKPRLNDVVVQALIYTLGSGMDVLQFARILNPDEDVYGNEYLGVRKQLAPLQLLVENDIERNPHSRYLIDETEDKEGISRYRVRFQSTAYCFLIDTNLNDGNTKIICPTILNFPGMFTFPSDVFDKENIFSKGPVNSLIFGGRTTLPVKQITEISNIGRNVTYDKDGKHECKYSFDDLIM
ncbi:MAG: hypothetical protein Q7R52_00925 [archaeon]|nr:hypothetical protein [archaeon]